MKSMYFLNFSQAENEHKLARDWVLNSLSKWKKIPPNCQEKPPDLYLNVLQIAIHLKPNRALSEKDENMNIL